MVDIQRCYYDGHKGWVSAKSGRVKFGNIIYPNILVAINHLRHK
jgi:hypothetical protein